MPLHSAISTTYTQFLDPKPTNADNDHDQLYLTKNPAPVPEAPWPYCKLQRGGSQPCASVGMLADMIRVHRRTYLGCEALIDYPIAACS